ncbi:MAG: sigma-54-dependent Fis family transcriptional regulator [Nitrospirae bacterium]|nr:sigma-54-dependent Fis family transcriptional regulator [Nitrospirota bacterium]MBI5694701.1 sigma-54-dependent Fis family transcriptional regulator [Nitrospirota bacterium]
MDENVLLVDDDENTRKALSIALGREGYNVQTAANGSEGIAALDGGPVDILVTDMRMPGISGMELLQYTRANYPEVMVIMITGHASVETAITALKDGAFDYITKPIKLDEVKFTLQKACEKRNLLIENLLLKQQLKGKYKFENIVGTSRAMHEVFSIMEKVIGTDSTVLIQGDSGTGKELVAKAIHYNGPRKDKPFVAINCAAIPGELLESELFGHVKGSFTGAVANRPGRFELANTGSIFLDEIGSMSLHLQGKILRVIQEREIERVGGGKRTSVDVRIISATNVDLEKAVRQGLFRDDLFYRLNVIPIRLPSLKERVEDIPLLVAHFIGKYNQRMGKDIKGVASGVMDCLTSHDWPGNIRELENVIERAVTLTDGKHIQVSALPDSVQGVSADPVYRMNSHIPDRGVDMGAELDRFESALISSAMKKAGGVKSKAAELLGIKRTTLIEKMKRLGL